MEYRLKKNGDFVKVFARGKKFYSESLLMVCMPEKSLKVGFSVSKKHGKANRRNRIKRLLRASFYSYRERIEILSFIIFVPKVREEYDYKTFRRDIHYLLRKAGLLK